MIALLALLMGCERDKGADDSPDTGAGRADSGAPDQESGHTDEPTETGDTGQAMVDGDRDGIPADADCDDTDPLRGGEEVPYDGIDQDCDGLDPVDVDGDGHDAVAAGGDDCDDTEPTAFPGGVEVMGTGVDEDCDGYTDLDVATLDDADVVIGGDSGDSTYLLGYLAVHQGIDEDGDGVGELLLSGGAFTLVGSSQLSGLVWDTDARVNVSRSLKGFLGVEVIAGTPTGRLVDMNEGSSPCSVQLGFVLFDQEDVSGISELDCGVGDAFVRLPQESMPFVDVPLWERDFDADGLPDIVYAAYGDPLAWMIPGSGMPSASVADVSDIATQLSMNESLLTQADALPDLDGDGYDTLAVVMYHYDHDLYLIDGDDLGTGGDPRTLASALVEDTMGSLITPLAPGDVDGDGRDDVLLLMNYGGDPTGEDCFGSVELFLGLGSGARVSVADSDGRLCAPLSTGEALLAADVGHLRPGGTDLAVAWGDDVRFLPVEDFPIGATRSILDVTDGIEAGGRAFAADQLRLLDLDGDGADDLVGVNGSLQHDYTDGGRYAGGVATVFFNPR